MKLSIYMLLCPLIMITTSAFSYYDETKEIDALSTSKSVEGHTFLTIKHGFVRETIPGTSVSAAYLTLYNNSSQQLTLTGVTGDVSQRIELHNHEMHNGLMQMRKIEYITIPANDNVILQPSGLHIMIFDLEKRLQADQEVDLHLQFLKAPNQKIVLPVKSIKNSHH